MLEWKDFLPYPDMIPATGELVKKHSPADFVNRVVLNPAMTTNVPAESRVIRPLSLSFKHLTMGNVVGERGYRRYFRDVKGFGEPWAQLTIGARRGLRKSIRTVDACFLG